MSKIYEALRQAELDRAKSSVAGAEADKPSDGQSAPEPAQIPAYSGGLRTLTTVSPISRATADKTPVMPIGDLKISATEVANTTLETATIDLAHVPQIDWTPSIHQLPALDERGSSVEQFRSLRSRMQEFRDLNALKSLLVSSGLPQEGKSFIAVNLAISFARHKAGRVLLIDGDMRRATLHKLLGCPQGPGLTEYLSGDASITEIMQRPSPGDDDHPLPPGLASLTFIPAGTEHDKAADLSGNRRFERLIVAAAPHFDWIVVDSSPVNLVSDGVNLARACDAVLLVARGGVTKFESAQRALGELKASKVLGFVLNAVKNPPIAGGYYGYDGYDKIEE
jgi:capsular exopolysaccharide synthesis family protein